MLLVLSRLFILSTLCWNATFDEICAVSMKQAVDLLRASLVTSCALSTALGDLIAKTPKKEPVCETQLRRSQRKKQKVKSMSILLS